jgi:hypothetical protein
VRYKEFLAEFKRVRNEWAYGNMPEGPAAQIDRLRALIPTIEEADRLAWAEDLLRGWESDWNGPHAERMTRAHDVLARVMRVQGSPADRIAEYRRGISEIAAIADETSDRSERAAIIGLNESLATLIEGTEFDRQPPVQP